MANATLKLPVKASSKKAQKLFYKRSVDSEMKDLALEQYALFRYELNMSNAQILETIGSLPNPFASDEYTVAAIGTAWLRHIWIYKGADL